MLTLLSPDAAGRIDGTLQKHVLDHLPLIPEHSSAPAAALVPIAYVPDYKFNPALLSVSRPVILDFLEHGWNAGDRDNRLGHGNLSQFGHLDTPEWRKLDQWAADSKPRLVFMRELHAAHRTDCLIPIEFPCAPQDIPPLQSRAEFDARPFEVFFCYGYSHPMRPRLHGDIIAGMGNRGLNVITDFCQLQNAPAAPSTWVAIYSPYWARKPMSEIFAIQNKAKISVSLFGAGRKSFRDSESCAGSAIARPVDPLAWSLPWTDQNSIQLPENNEIQALDHATRRPDLYDVYAESQKAARYYNGAEYARNYILPAIVAGL